MNLVKIGQLVKSPVTGVGYLIQQKLGEGGFGQAYRATPKGRMVQGRDVCLKVTRDQDSWHREAYFGELLRGIPRALSILDSFPLPFPPGRKQKVIYCLAIELAPGGTVDRYLEGLERAWSEKRIKREIVGLLGALDRLHGGRAVHRDITPFNVFVCNRGTLKLGDFGIARHAPDAKGLPADMFNAYFAPDAAGGGRSTWLAADDIWQMGQLLAMLVQGEASLLGTRDVRLLACSDHLKGIIRRAIGERRHRYTDAHEMIEALEQLPVPHKSAKVSTLQGKVVVFTGPLSIRRADATALVLAAGGEVADSVTALTNIVVRGAKSPNFGAGSKGVKLIETESLRQKGQDIRIIDEIGFRRALRPPAGRPRRARNDLVSTEADASAFGSES